MKQSRLLAVTFPLKLISYANSRMVLVNYNHANEQRTHQQFKNELCFSFFCTASCFSRWLQLAHSQST